jgi:hypothetical protein
LGLALSMSFAVALGACGDDRADGGCEADDECKGDRICEDGECVDRGSLQGGSFSGGGGSAASNGSGSGSSGEAIAATCNKLQSIGCPVPSFSSYEACAAAFEQALATCGTNADLTSYMSCVQMYASCDPMTGEVIAYECFGAGLNVSWCFGTSASSASGASGAGGGVTSGAGGSWDGGTGASSSSGYGGYDGG